MRIFLVCGLGSKHSLTSALQQECHSLPLCTVALPTHAVSTSLSNISSPHLSKSPPRKASAKMFQGQQGMSGQVVLYENFMHFSDGATPCETEDFFPPSFNSRAEHKDFLTS